LVGQLVGWLVGRLVGWLFGQLVGWSVGRLVGRLVGWSVSHHIIFNVILSAVCGWIDLKFGGDLHVDLIFKFLFFFFLNSSSNSSFSTSSLSKRITAQEANVL
jgi:hypothetical protein